MGLPVYEPARLRVDRDVQRLSFSLAEKYPDAAKCEAGAAIERAKVIAQRLGLGRPVEAVEPEYREWLINFGDSGHRLKSAAVDGWPLNRGVHRHGSSETRGNSAARVPERQDDDFVRIRAVVDVVPDARQTDAAQVRIAGSG